MNNVIIRNCVAQDNGTNGATSTIAAGVTVHPRADVHGSAPIFKVTIENCTLNSNGSASATHSGGIVLLGEPEFPISNVLIQKNTLAYNTLDGIKIVGNVTGVVIKNNEADRNTGIGFNVLNAVPNLVLGNIAYANTGGNYQGVPASVIREATNVNLPDTVGAKNLSITV